MVGWMTGLFADILGPSAEVNIRGRDGVCPMHCAAKSGNLQILEMFLCARAATGSRSQQYVMETEILDASRKPGHWDHDSSKIGNNRD